MKKIGLYIHIPFCKSKCYYCDFNSYANREGLIDDYVKAVKQELKVVNINNYIVKTLYIGGGTPSIINEKHIEDIIKDINISQAKEITIEINPRYS